MVHRTLFEAHEVKRAPMTLSEDAQAWIDTSHKEGRRFPQALRELFGAVSPEITIYMDMPDVSEHFSDPDPTLVRLCRITIRKGQKKAVFLIDGDHLHDTHASRHPAFSALDAATELCRLYQEGLYGQ